MNIDFRQLPSNPNCVYRYLQTLNSIAAEHNSTIIFPMPMNIMDHFMGGSSSKKAEVESLGI